MDHLFTIQIEGRRYSLSEVFHEESGDSSQVQLLLQGCCEQSCVWCRLPDFHRRLHRLPLQRQGQLGACRRQFDLPELLDDLHSCADHCFAGSRHQSEPALILQDSALDLQRSIEIPMCRAVNPIYKLGCAYYLSSWHQQLIICITARSK